MRAGTALQISGKGRGSIKKEEYAVQKLRYSREEDCLYPDHGQPGGSGSGICPFRKESECLISMNGDKQAFQGNLAMNGNHTQVRGLRDRQDCRARVRTA